MLSQTFTPAPSLQHIVRSYHIRHFLLHTFTGAVFKPYPARPEQSLIFYPRQPEVVEYVADHTKIVRPRAIAMNQYTVRTNRHTANDFLVIIVELRPGILHRLTGAPLYPLLNTDSDTENLFSTEVKRVSDRLNSTGDYEEMIAIVERFVTYLASILKRGDHAVDKVADYLLANNYNASLDWLADQACLSTRQLERKFKERIGCSPKIYSRLVRMHHTYKIKTERPESNWFDIAIACGYHDYQHLAKDYHVFAGCSPNELFREQAIAPESRVGLRETFC